MAKLRQICEISSMGFLKMQRENWRPPFTVPKLLLLMKTNFYLLNDVFQIVCQN